MKKTLCSNHGNCLNQGLVVMEPPNYDVEGNAAEDSGSTDADLGSAERLSEDSGITDACRDLCNVLSEVGCPNEENEGVGNISVGHRDEQQDNFEERAGILGHPVSASEPENWYRNCLQQGFRPWLKLKILEESLKLGACKPMQDAVPCSIANAAHIGSSTGCVFSRSYESEGQSSSSYQTLHEDPNRSMKGIFEGKHLCVTSQTVTQHRRGRAFFYYELPLLEETGVWVPVSVPPMDAEDFERGLYETGTYGGGYFPEAEHLPEQSGRETDSNLWETLYGVLDLLFEKGRAFAECVDIPSSSVGSNNKSLQEPEVAKWRLAHMEFCPSLVNGVSGDVQAIKSILEAEPPHWMPDSSASACMLCGTSFRPLTCGRHHCRYCGGIFCSGCSGGRCLLPLKFRERNPQRVCDTCWLRLEPTQRILGDQVSNAAQVATHDVTDLSCSRAWLNSPWGTTMEQEVFKATNTLRCFTKVGKLKPEQSIPDAVLSGARGLAILTCFKAGVGLTYKIGTGLVVARRLDGTWSAPSAIASCGIGWGFQVGGELTDYIIVLRTEEAVKAFSGRIHFSVGAGLSAAAGPIGRAAEADIRAGDGGAAACYTYSCSKGAFIGCSLEGNVVTTRSATNVHFYGDSCITTSKILLGAMPRPRAAAPLYNALADLFEKQDQADLT